MDMSNIAHRLEAKFGLGDRPTVRRKLYRRLEREVEAHGEVAYECVAIAAADAETADKPGRYFSKAVTSRLRERGLLEGGGVL